VAEPKTSRSVRKAFTRKEKMNDYVSLLLETDAAKRKLVQLFQPEGLGLANQPRIATVVDESIPAIQTWIKQTSRLFRENRRKHGLARKGAPTVLRTSQRGEMKRDLTVSGFVFALVLVGVILAAHTDRPVFWLLIGPVPVAVLHTIRTFVRQLLRRRENLFACYEGDR
jgi:hypothetical protein